MNDQPNPANPAPNNSSPGISTSNLPSSAQEKRLPQRTPRGHGKIAQLPKLLRDQINRLLDDGLSYSQILAQLQHSNPPLPYTISRMALSRWHRRGYQLHLALQERLAEVRINRETAFAMMGDDTATLPEAALQILASQYYEMLGDLSPESLKRKLLEDPLQYIRFINVFARLAREILNLKKHRQASAKEAALELKRLNPKRHLTDAEDQLLSDTMDDFLLKPRRHHNRLDPTPASNQEESTNPEKPPITDS